MPELPDPVQAGAVRSHYQHPRWAHEGPALAPIRLGRRQLLAAADVAGAYRPTRPIALLHGGRQWLDRRPPHVHEIAGPEIRLLLRRRRAPENRIAMREAPETLDQIPTGSRPT